MSVYKYNTCLCLHSYGHIFTIHEKAKEKEETNDTITRYNEQSPDMSEWGGGGHAGTRSAGAREMEKY